MDIKSLAEQYNDYIIDRRRYYHTCPELSGEEKNTRAHLKEDLEALGITDIHEMETCYGLTATITASTPSWGAEAWADLPSTSMVKPWQQAMRLPAGKAIPGAS